MDHQVEDQEWLAGAAQIVRCSRTQLCDAHYYEAQGLLHSVKSAEVPKEIVLKTYKQNPPHGGNSIKNHKAKKMMQETLGVRNRNLFIVKLFLKPRKKDTSGNNNWKEFMSPFVWTGKMKNFQPQTVLHACLSKGNSRSRTSKISQIRNLQYMREERISNQLTEWSGTLN